MQPGFLHQAGSDVRPKERLVTVMTGAVIGAIAKSVIVADSAGERADSFQPEAGLKYLLLLCRVIAVLLCG